MTKEHGHEKINPSQTLSLSLYFSLSPRIRLPKIALLHVTAPSHTDTGILKDTHLTQTYTHVQTSLQLILNYSTEAECTAKRKGNEKNAEGKEREKQRKMKKE